MTPTEAAGEAIAAPSHPSFLPAQWRTIAREGVRYFGASAVALAVDYGLLVFLHRALGVQYLLAATLSFTAGLCVAWALSVRFVFRDRRTVSRWHELGGFAATGIAGLLLTQVLMAVLVGGLGVAAELAKLPVAGFVFVFNFASRRALLFTPAASVGGRALWIAKLASAIPFVTGAAVFLLSRPTPGIVSDAKIYIGRAVADLNPTGVGRDMMFALDGQSQFSLFTPFARALVAHLSPGYSAVLLAGAAQALWIVALLAFARTVCASRWLCVAVFAALLPASYGNGLLAFGEPLAVPRPFAEAFVLFALLAWIRRRPPLACAFLLLAALFHPIMALAGVGTLAVLALRQWPRTGAMIAVGFAGALGVAAVAVPQLATRLAPADEAWLAVLHARNGYLFPQTWSAAAVALAAVQACTALLAMRHMSPSVARVVGAALIVGCAGVGASVFVATIWPSALVLQAQPWRAWWLVAAFAAVAFGTCVAVLGRGSSRDRVALAALTLAWIGSSPTTGPLLALAALVIDRLDDERAKRITPRHAVWVWAAVVALVLGPWVGSLGGIAHLFDGWQDGARPNLAHITLVAIAEPLLMLGVLAAMTSTVAQLGIRAQAGVCAGLVLLVAFVWNDASTFVRALGRGETQVALADTVGPEPGSVLWLGGTDEAWYWLARPNWAAAIQGAGAVFSRPLATAFDARARVLQSEKLGDLTERRTELAAADFPHPTADSLRRICARDDAPVAIIAPLRVGESAPTEWHARAVWHAPVPRVDLPHDASGSVVRVEDYAVTRCADLR